MSTNHTPSYNLCQWEATDQVLRSDFNQDNAKIDSALAAQAEALASAVAELKAGAVKMEASHYVGSGTASQTIDLPFKPKFMLIQSGSGTENTYMIFCLYNGVLFQSDHTPHLLDNNSGFLAETTDQGMKITATGSGSTEELARIALNTRKGFYLYLALG